MKPRVTHVLVLVALGASLLASACSKNPEKQKQQYLENGNRFYKEAKYREASVEYRNAIRIDPLFGEARYKLGETYLQLKDARGAYAEFVRAAEVSK